MEESKYQQVELMNDIMDDFYIVINIFILRTKKVIRQELLESKRFIWNLAYGCCVNSHIHLVK